MLGIPQQIRIFFKMAASRYSFVILDRRLAKYGPSPKTAVLAIFRSLEMKSPGGPEKYKAKLRTYYSFQ